MRYINLLVVILMVVIPVGVAAKVFIDHIINKLHGAYNEADLFGGLDEDFN